MAMTTASLGSNLTASGDFIFPAYCANVVPELLACNIDITWCVVLRSFLNQTAYDDAVHGLDCGPPSSLWPSIVSQTKEASARVIVYEAPTSTISGVTTADRYTVNYSLDDEASAPLSNSTPTSTTASPGNAPAINAPVVATDTARATAAAPTTTYSSNYTSNGDLIYFAVCADIMPQILACDIDPHYCVIVHTFADNTTDFFDQFNDGLCNYTAVPSIVSRSTAASYRAAVYQKATSTVNGTATAERDTILFSLDDGGPTTQLSTLPGGGVVPITTTAERPRRTGSAAPSTSSGAASGARMKRGLVGVGLLGSLLSLL